MAKATVLAYTEKEIAAYEILKQNAGTALTSTELKEMGVANAVLTSIINKANKVANGELEVPAGMEVFKINKEDKVVQETVEKTLKAYSI